MTHSDLSDLSTLQELLPLLEDHGSQSAIFALREDRMDEWSFERLSRESQQLATGLREMGLEPQSRAAILAPNRPEWIVACLALIQAGVIPVLIDAQISRQALGRLLDDSGASCVFSVSKLVDRLSDAAGDQPRKIVLLDVADDHPASWRRLLSQQPLRARIH